MYIEVNPSINPFMSLMFGLGISNILFSVIGNRTENITFNKSIINKNTFGILMAMYYNPKLVEYIPNIIWAACLTKFLE